MAAAFVAVTKLSNGGGPSAAGSVSSTAGNALFVLATGYYGGSVGAPSFSVSGGGTWTTHGTDNQHFGTTDNLVEAFASCPSATGGSQTITITYGSPAGFITAYVYEFSGMATSSILDTLGSGAQGGGTPMSTAALSNAGANAVFLALAGDLSISTQTHATTGTGWTMPAGGDETNGFALVTNVTAYKIVSSIASQTETWTDSPSVAYGSYVAAFKQAGGAAVVEPDHLMLIGCT